MIHRHHKGAYPASRPGGCSETESLQSDVMRFMAIIGLCLTAIFALIQGMPFHRVSDEEESPGDSASRQESESLQIRIHELRNELDDLNTEIEARRLQQERARQGIKATRVQISSLTRETEQIREERDRLRDDLDDLNRLLAESRQELRKIRQKSLEKNPSRYESQQGLSREAVLIDQTGEEGKPQRQDRKRQTVPAAAEPRNDQRAGTGFTLRFASATALNRLVTARLVKLYGLQGKTAWRLSLQGNAPVFAPGSFPRTWHEMDPATVPPAYTRALDQTTDAPVSVVWGVQLTPGMEQNISRLAGKRRGGTLIIESDGQIRLQTADGREMN